MKYILRATLVLLILLLVCLIQSANSQDVGWIRTFGGSGSDYGVRITQTADGGYVFLGRTFSYAVGNDDYYLLKLSQNSDTVWTKSWGGELNVAPRDLVTTGDGGFLICGYNRNGGTDSTLYVVQLDSLGYQQWDAFYPYLARANAVVKTPNDTYVMCGFTKEPSWTQPRGLILCLDGKGDSVFSAVIGTGHESIQLNDLTVLQDGSIMAAGLYSDDITSDVRVCLVKASSDGDILWRKEIGEGPSQTALAITTMGNQRIAIVGLCFLESVSTAYMWQVDSSGAQLDSRALAGNYPGMATDVCTTGDGGVVTCIVQGTSTPSPKYTSSIICYSPNMVQLFRFDVDPNYEEVHLYSIENTKDGGYIAGGYSDAPDSALNMYAVKIDIPGCCGRYTGGFTGNTNCDLAGTRNLSDITTLIDRIYLSHSPLCCEQNANVDGDTEGDLTIGDITMLISHVYITHAQTAPCQ